MKTFTQKFMLENKGCYSTKQLNDCSFMEAEPVTLESILDSEINLKDKYWFVCKKLLTKEQNQKIAIGVAEITLEIFENKYPEDKRPRKTIQAVKDYLAGKITLAELREARYTAADAYADAYAAAYAATAAAAYAYAYAAAYAAGAAYAYADAAAYAAGAAYAAAYAAGAAYENKFQNTLLNYLKDFCDKNL